LNRGDQRTAAIGQARGCCWCERVGEMQRHDSYRIVVGDPEWGWRAGVRTLDLAIRGSLKLRTRA
jgi:hypothetical protein